MYFVAVVALAWFLSWW